MGKLCVGVVSVTLKDYRTGGSTVPKEYFFPGLPQICLLRNLDSETAWGRRPPPGIPRVAESLRDTPSEGELSRRSVTSFTSLLNGPEAEAVRTRWQVVQSVPSASEGAPISDVRARSKVVRNS